MSTKLEDLRTCNDLIVKHGHALQRSVSDLESATSGSGVGDKKSPDVSDIQSKVKILNERATLFKITSNAMINACSEYLELTQNQGSNNIPSQYHPAFVGIGVNSIVTKINIQFYIFFPKKTNGFIKAYLFHTLPSIQVAQMQESLLIK